MLTHRIDRDEKWMTRDEVATHLRVSTRTVDRYIEKGILQASRLPGGRLVRIAASDVAALAEGGDAA